MNARVDTQPAFSRRNLKGLVGPLLIIMILGMMVLPLPPFLLDMLFTFNIAMAMIVMLVSLYTQKPLEFSVFPTVLLVTTLLRLSLNVASTRVVLLEGHTGPDAAGKVIEAFGHFLVGGNYTVGIVVFVILVVINFVVITKGAGRIAEVSARFTLDAMPGKQMAIDADLNAGLIGEDEARKRRATISQEADFFGSMDGASKFVRGDAVAGILILFINVIGGLLVGIFQHDMSVSAAANNYTLLAIGDGLVAQIPALIISTAAGLVVSRVATDEDVGQQFVGQLFNRPSVLYITAAILALMGIIPSMPHVAFLTLAGVLSSAAYYLEQKGKVAQQAPPGPPPEAVQPPEMQEVGWNDVTPVDALGLEVGYRLIPLVDRAQDGELLRRIRGIRKKFAQEMGFLVPPVHIRDNLELRPNGYRITLKGVEIGQGEAYSGMYLAINPGRVLGPLPGTATTDPAFGLPAIWVEANLRDQAQTYGYTVVDSSTVVATHLSNIIQIHAAELLGREETQQLLDHVAKESPKLVEDLVPKLLPLGAVQKVLQSLLDEGVHIRDMRTIIDTLADRAARTQDVGELTAAVRVALGRAIMQQIYPGAAELQVMTLEPALEQIMMQAAQGAGEGLGLEPGLAESLMKQTANAVRQQEQMGLAPVLMVPAPLRPMLSRFLRRIAPQLKVVSQAEIPDSRTIRVTAVVGGQGMNVKKFRAANTREALRQVRDALGADAIILSNRPVDGMIEIMAVANMDMASLVTPVLSAAPTVGEPRRAAPPEPPRAVAAEPVQPAQPRPVRREEIGVLQRIRQEAMLDSVAASIEQPAPKPKPQPQPAPPLEDGMAQEMMREIRSLRGMLEGQLAGLAWGEMQRSNPVKVEILRRMLTAGFSPGLSRQVLERLPDGSDAARGVKWVQAALVHNLRAVQGGDDIVDRGGVYALVGPTGVGKTTTVAKLAARCRLKHGANKLALLTTDSYRIGAHEQLKIYGKILGVPVYAVKDESDLQFTLSDLQNKHLVLIDTVGMSQRDRRMAEQIALLTGGGRNVKRLLLIGANAQGNTLEDVVRAYSGAGMHGCILTKVDEAIALGGALDVVVRHKLALQYITNGQRVPEDLHLANAAYLVDRAFRPAESAASFNLEEEEYPLVMASGPDDAGGMGAHRG